MIHCIYCEHICSSNFHTREIKWDCSGTLASKSPRYRVGWWSNQKSLHHYQHGRVIQSTSSIHQIIFEIYLTLKSCNLKCYTHFWPNPSNNYYVTFSFPKCEKWTQFTLSKTNTKVAMHYKWKKRNSLFLQRTNTAKSNKRIPKACYSSKTVLQTISNFGLASNQKNSHSRLLRKIEGPYLSPLL